MNITGIKRLAKSLSDEKRESKYKYLYSVWVLENSDKWFIDGVEVSEEKKFMIKCANYNIEPKPESFVASKTKNGKELHESNFLKVEIIRIEDIIKQLNESDKVFEAEKRNLNSYLLELKSKLAPKEFAETVQKSHFKKIALDKKSIFFYSKFIANWYNQRKTELENNDNLSCKSKLLDSFLFLYKSYFSQVIKLIDFSIEYNYEGHEIIMYKVKKKELVVTVSSLSQFSDIIKRYILNGKYSDAIKIQEFCLLVTDEIRNYLERDYLINIDNTFLKNHFEKIYQNIEKSIDFEKIKFLKENSIKKTANQQRPNRTDIAYFSYYTSISKELKLNNNFPSDKAWQEIGELFGKNWKNVQEIYLKIFNIKSERLKKSKGKNLSYVIEEMLNEYPKAKKEAQSELKTLKLNS
jgi:hypothetical protein